MRIIRRRRRRRITRRRADSIAPRIPPSRVEEKLPGKRETTTTTTTARENKISKLGRAVLMVEIGLTDAKTALNRPSGAPKTSQIKPYNAPKAIFGSKKRADEAQESSKTNLEALFGRSRGPKELPRAPQELPKGARESPQTIAKPFLDRKRSFLQNVNIVIGKSKFSL